MKTFVFVGMASVLAMCNKDLPETGPSAVVQENVSQKIRSFIRKADAPVRVKRIVEYTKEEALWMVEAALNFEKVDPELKKTELKYDEFNVQVPLTNDKVTEGHVIDAYLALKAIMEAEPFATDEKLTAMDVVVKTENGMLKFTTYRVVGKEEPNGEPQALNTNYSGSYISRQWAVYSTLFPCGQTRGDLAIQGRLNQTVLPLASSYDPNTGIVVTHVLTDVELWRVWASTPEGEQVTEIDLENHILPATLFPNLNDPDGQAAFEGSYNDYYTYLRPPVSGYPDAIEPCLYPEAMTYLTQAAWELMHIVRATYVSDPTLQFIGCAVDGGAFTISGGPSFPSFRQNVNYLYGRWQTVSTGGIDG